MPVTKRPQPITSPAPAFACHLCPRLTFRRAPVLLGSQRDRRQQVVDAPVECVAVLKRELQHGQHRLGLVFGRRRVAPRARRARARVSALDRPRASAPSLSSRGPPPLALHRLYRRRWHAIPCSAQCARRRSAPQSPTSSASGTARVRSDVSRITQSDPLRSRPSSQGKPRIEQSRPAPTRASRVERDSRA